MPTADEPGSSSEPVVVSIGGSILFHDDGSVEYAERLADLLRRLGRTRPIAVTTGGGPVARRYIRLGRSLGLTDVELDELGIEVTRLHARLLAARIGPPTPSHPPTSVREAAEAVRRASPVVLGGTEPGHTTDAVAALLAVRLRARRVVNATDVDGVYDADPREKKDARRLDRLTWPAFRTMLAAAARGEPGQSFLFDHVGSEALERARIPLLVLDGRDLGNLEAGIEGRPARGSWIGA